MFFILSVAERKSAELTSTKIVTLALVRIDYIIF